jgi:hypothetical protein
MTPKQFARACSLYRRYKVTTREYEELAANAFMSVGDLNARCHKHFQLERESKQNKVAASLELKKTK